MIQNTDHELIALLRLDFNLPVELATDDQVLKIADETFLGALIRFAAFY